MRAYLAATWQQFTEWAAWSTWNYARKRAIRRAQWLPHEAQDAQSDATPDQRRVRANEARQVLENRHFVAAWDALNAAIEAQAIACDPDNKDKAARITLSKQLLHALRREFTRKLEDGYVAEVELDEISRRRANLRFMR